MKKERIIAIGMRRKIAFVTVFLMGMSMFAITNSVNADTPTGESYMLYEHYGYTWLDAEKRAPDDGKGIGPNPGEDDDWLCWAATASNVLEWTGWGLVGGMWDTDAILDEHKNYFNDTGAWMDDSWHWWLNGYEPGPPLKLVTGGGNYWSSYTWSNYYHDENDDTKVMEAIDNWLHAGYGVGIGIFDGGHAITVWGFNYDPNVDKTSNPHDYYLGIWVSDSDSDKNSPPYSGAPARDYMNRLSYYEVEWNSTANHWYMPNYGGGWMISRVQALEPFPSGRPVADAGGPYTVNEGTPVIFDASDSNDAEGDTINYRWDIDFDGNLYRWDTAWSPSTTTTHTWYDDYSGDVVLQIVANHLLDIDKTIITVNNVAPTVNAGLNQIVNEGDMVYFSGSFTDPGTLDTHTIEWDFGDGNTSSGSLNPIHIYGDDGVYTVTLTVTDDDGGVGMDTMIVTVNNVAPTVSPITMSLPYIDNPDFILPIVHTLSFEANATDPGSDDLIFTWNWGDGTYNTTIYYNDGMNPDPYPSPEINPMNVKDTKNHIYFTPGTYVVTLTVEDDDGGVTIVTWTLKVLNASEAKHDINDYIQNLSDNLFKSKAEKRKNAFNHMFNAIDNMLDEEKYNGAIHHLQKNIRGKCDGYIDGKKGNDWIKGDTLEGYTAQWHICNKIDDLIAYLETFL
ncbi:MAG: hypothetical protein DRN29_02310 [Thermoplasmata archaeon]|nr:MAG: hypothetical protein DRN29_02310 [Thermoplasmata archaeon]